MARKIYRFEPVGWDIYDAHANTPPAGTVVQKYQPFGCPKNGTMNHCFVQDACTGHKYGLVHQNSLVALL
jgi:hypothetical protein